MKISPSDCLHQKYLTINLGSTSDWRQLKLPLVRLFWRWRGRCLSRGAVWGRECRKRSSVLPLNLSDTVATSQDGSSLEFIAAIAGRHCYIQDASGWGLGPRKSQKVEISYSPWLSYLTIQKVKMQSALQLLFGYTLVYVTKDNGLLSFVFVATLT